MAESMKPVAWMHCYRKIAGGARYEQADIGEYGPDPQPGFEHYDAYPLYTASQLEQARKEEAAKHAAELERLRELAATAEKWRGIASARHGDGRTLAETQNEARAEEREACAKICDEERDRRVLDTSREAVSICAMSIRARNEKGGS